MQIISFEYYMVLRLSYQGYMHMMGFLHSLSGKYIVLDDFGWHILHLCHKLSTYMHLYNYPDDMPQFVGTHCDCSIVDGLELLKQNVNI
jgi:hypothetical protein